MKTIHINTVNILFNITRILVILGVLFISAGDVSIAFADEGDGPGGAGRAVDMMVTTFKRLGGLFIKGAYSVAFIIFAVGMVKNGVAAHAAQQFGVAGQVPRHILDIIMGIVMFIFFLITLPLVDLIIDNVSDIIPTDYEITVPSQ